MSIDNAVASNWVLEKFSRTPEGFSLRGTTKGYASFSRAFKQGATVFYAASDDQGNREAGYGTYRDNMITDITVTATLVGSTYSEGNPPRVNFRNGGTIGGTFNALAFNTLWNRKDGNGAGMVISDVEPGDPIEGMQWLDSTTAEVWIWDGEKWLEFPTGDVGANVQIEDFPPSNPRLGDMWTDYGTTGELYIWDGRFWVSMTGDGGPKVILGGEEGGAIDLPENITLDNLEDAGDVDKALARHISSSGVGKWLPIKTGDVETDPEVTFRDAKGRFRSTKDYADLNDQLKVNRFIANELDALNEAVDTIGEKGYDDTALTKRIEKEELARTLADAGLKESLLKDINDLEEKLSDNSLTDEEKARRLKAPLQYRGYMEMDADGKPIAPWDEVFLGENEFGVDRELGGWFGHSTAGFQYGNWDMRDCDWIWLVSDNLAEAYENNDYQAIDTAWKVTPKNVGDTFALEMLQVGLDAWEDDAGFYAFKGTHELEFRVEEIYWPEHPKGWSNTYAPMVRVSQVRDRDYYRYYLREKPEYNFDGDKAISVHLTNLIITNNDLYATKDDLEAIEFPEGVDLGPVEDRLDAIEDVLPREPIVVPPVDIGSGKILIDHPTRPSGADKPPAEECWMWHMDADRTGNPANEMKTTVPTEHQGNVILDGINAVWFKQGDRVQKWNTSNGGWWTGGNLWHMSAQSTEGDDLVDGQPFEIYYIDPNTTGDNFTDVISREESKADDAELRELIEGIEFPETDLTGYVTTEQFNTLADDSAATDNSLFKAIEEESTKTNVAVSALQIELNNVDKKSQEKDRDLQKQIDELDIPDAVDLTGYATEEWVNGQIDAIELPDDVDLTPVTDRLDEIEGVLPKEEPDIKPVEIGQQFAKVTGTRPTGSAGEAGNVLIWKAETGGPGSPYNECKFIVPDPSLVNPAVTTIWWKQGNRVQRWEMNGSGWFTNTNVLHYSANTTSGDDLVTREPIELYYEDPRVEGPSFVDVISREESKADDAELRGLIESSSRSITTTQVMMGAYSYFDMPMGRFTLVQQNGESATLSPLGAHGFRFYPSSNEWWVDSHEVIAGGYISILDPYTGKVQFAGRVESAERDYSATNRWTFMMPNDRYQWGDNLNADGQFLITLSGCLREK